MEWSSDGYVLAVGWDHGWAIWSVGGRCLAWSFGVEYEVDEEKYVSPCTSLLGWNVKIVSLIRFQDAFMYGIRDLVCLPRFPWGLLATSIFSFGLLGISNSLYSHIPLQQVSSPISGQTLTLIVPVAADGQVFVIPFAKSATTGQHSPVRFRLLCIYTLH